MRAAVYISLVILAAARATAAAQVINDWSVTGDGIVTYVEKGAVRDDDYAAEGIISGWEGLLVEFERAGDSAAEVDRIVDGILRARGADRPNVFTGPDGTVYELPQMIAEDGTDMYLLTEEGMSIYLAFDAPVYLQDVDEETLRWVRYYAYTNKSRTRRLFARYARWEGKIKAHFRSAGVPEELAELCLIESGCTETALSPAGALGMWQIMPATGRHYGMRIDSEVDERLDPNISLRTAARILLNNHRRLGDWTIATAAYNCGAGRFRAGQQWNDVKGRLPKETRQYIPGLIAIHYVWTYRRQLGLDD